MLCTIDVSVKNRNSTQHGARGVCTNAIVTSRETSPLLSTLGQFSGNLQHSNYLSSLDFHHHRARKDLGDVILKLSWYLFQNVQWRIIKRLHFDQHDQVTLASYLDLPKKCLVYSEQKTKHSADTTNLPIPRNHQPIRNNSETMIKYNIYCD